MHQMGKTAPGAPATPIETLDRGLRVLESLAGAGPDGLSLGALARDLEMNKSTAHRALSTLRLRDYVTQDPVSGDYRLGPRLIHLADQHLSEDNLPGLLSGALTRICEQVDELVHLGLLNLPWVTYVAKVEPERAVRVWSRIGAQAPAATTALGRAILACLPAVPYAELRASLPTGGKAHLAQAIATAKARGYATELEENEPGIACVAVAILRHGQPRAAISVTAPVERMSAQRGAEIAAISRAVLAEALPPGLELPAANQ
jgi:DNA-binding IclR family transcriptional regulator